jgi:glycosyltransferase involved in cell wall biosynthesis
LNAGTKAGTSKGIVVSGQLSLDCWVVIAAYNEESVIASVVSRVLPVCPNIVVVDDGSADATGDQASLAGAHVLTHPCNLGQGAALQTGITYALRNGAGTIVTFDADGQHQAADIEPMLRALRDSGADIAFGSRFLGSTANMSVSKRWLLKAAILFTRLTTGVRMTDSHNGFRAMTRHCAQSILIRHNRMAHASELVSLVAEKGLRPIEVPVHIEYTEYSMRKGQRLSGALEIVLDLIGRKILR